MHCHDYQAATLRSCCATLAPFEVHAPDCNRRLERRMVAGAEERVRVGRELTQQPDDWRPVDRLVGAITMWDAPHDPTATTAVPDAVPDATGYPGEDLEVELGPELEPDPLLDAFVRRLRVLVRLALLVPVAACGAFEAGSYAAAQFTPDRAPAAAWGQLATIVASALGLGWLADELFGDVLAERPGAGATRSIDAA